MRRIPLWLKLAYTAFVAVLVPYYWTAYTPWNFLYFCDIALLVTMVGLWTESAFLISSQAVAIVLAQLIWVADLISQSHITGMTGYMFNPAIPLFVRGLSLFHGWLPFLLLWSLARLGYDRRAVGVQSACAIVVLLVCYFVAPGPSALAANPNAAVNINYVYGLDDAHPQTQMAPALWLGLLTTFTLGCLYLPTHAALRRIFESSRAEAI
jgi:hypothetical protein